MLERVQCYDLGDGFVSADRIAAVAADTREYQRRAIEAILNDLEKWGRYIVTDRPERLKSSSWCASAAAADWRLAAGRAVAASVEVKPEAAAMRVSASGPAPRSAGWRGSPPRLYKSFQEEVEATAKKP